jgi:cytochrome P450
MVPVHHALRPHADPGGVGHELVSAVLRDRPDGYRRPTITAVISDEMGGRPGVFLAEGAAWRDQRRMVMAALAPHAVKAYFPSLVSVAQRLQKRWQQAARDGSVIDLAEDLKRYSVDIIAGLAFGTEVNTIDGGEEVIQRHMDVVLPAVARRSIALFPYWRYIKLPQDRHLDASLAALNQSVDELIAAARAAGGGTGAARTSRQSAGSDDLRGRRRRQRRR